MMDDRRGLYGTLKYEGWILFKKIMWCSLLVSINGIVVHVCVALEVAQAACFKQIVSQKKKRGAFAKRFIYYDFVLSFSHLAAGKRHHL
jgi:hypothetical protein